MRVTLIFPSIQITGFDSFGKYDDIDANEISHGLCSIAACAKKEGFCVDLIDLRKCKGWKDFRNKFFEESPDVVGLTMNSVDYSPVMHCIDIIKETKPDTVVVVGGIHPSIDAFSMQNEPKIDFIVQGEGEISFVELLKAINSGQRQGKIIQGIRPDLDKLPFVDRELFDYQETIKHPYYPGGYRVPGIIPPFITIIAGRGCIYNCNFCQPAERILFGKEVRRRSVSNVIEELILLRNRYHFKSMMIHDDCLTEDENWVEDFCEAYQKNGFSAPFICQSRVDLICKNEGLIKRISEVGLKLLLIGFESGNQRVLNFLRKGTTVEQNIMASEICKKYKIKIAGNFMMGIPTETKTELMDTVKVIKKIKPDFLNIGFYTPFPGSDLFQYCKERDLSLINDYKGFIRDSDSCKIKGVDYAFVKRAWEEVMGLSFPRKILKRIRKYSGVRLLEKSFRKSKIGCTVLRNLRQNI